MLFDNPGAGLRQDGRWRRLAADTGTGFYRGIGRALTAIGGSQLQFEVGLCCLPADSYHVTAWDGINADNLSVVTSRNREQAAIFLAGLPDTLGGQPAFVEVARRGLCEWSQPLQLRFDRLVNWNQRMLVAQLCPAATSPRAYAEFEARRERLKRIILL